MKIHLFRKTHIFILFIIFLSGCQQNKRQNVEDRDEKELTASPISFPIKRGINISHWLSQSQKFGEERQRFITESDIEFLAGVGYDHIRLPVDEEHLWDEQGQKLPEGFQLIHNAITWCYKYQMRIILDLHIIRSHYFNSKENTLFKSAEQQDKFINMWLQLSDEFHQYSNSMLAYELLNEAVAENHEDWNNLINSAIKVLRVREPNRKIVIGSNGWQNPDNFSHLRVPEDDPNLILSFHFYDPHIFTHYRAHWETTGQFRGPVKYPGQTISPGSLRGLDKDLSKELEQYTVEYTIDSIRSKIKKPLDYAKSKNLPLYCGEFGCFHTTPYPDKLSWYADVRKVFEENNIAWANWDYKGGFAIFDFKTGKPNRALIDVLLIQEIK